MRLFLVLFLITIFSSCTNKENAIKANSETGSKLIYPYTETGTDVNNSTESNRSVGSYTEIDNKNEIIVENTQFENGNFFIINDLHYGIITYPFFNNIEYESKINATIFEEIQGINAYYGDCTDDSKVNYSITRLKNDYLSIVFDGLIYNGHSAYPTKVLSCMVINRRDGKRIKLNEIVTIDSEFFKLFIDNANVVLSKMNTSVDEYYGDSIKTKLKNADNKIEDIDIPGGYINPSLQTYLTDNDLVIRVEIAHVYGDFFDVFIPLSEVHSVN
jgi:hypothetical protein